MINIINSKIKAAEGHILPYRQYQSRTKINAAIILIYEIFGMTSHINDVALEFSRNGFLVNVPDIFSRLENNVNLPYDKDGFSKGLKLKKKLGWNLPVMDIVSLAASLKKDHKVLVLGYCYGGSLAWIAMQKASIFDKGVCYYGSSISNFLKSELNCPAILHFGNEDQGIPKSSINKIRKYIERQKNKIFLYEYENADHGFNCSERKSFNKYAAEVAFGRTLNFLKGT